MTIIQINTCSYGSTGKIAIELCQIAEACGNKAYLCVPNGRHNKNKYAGEHIWIGGRFSEDLHLILSRLTGLHGYFSILATWRFIRKLKGIRPDLIHLHNLHNSYICIPMLFQYIKKVHIPVVWTLHDCWSFTGHCPHFDMVGCDKWKIDCSGCSQYREYPQSWVNHSRLMFRKKKKWFTGVKSLTVVTPSVWLAGQVKQSFLKAYPIQIIYNGIDLTKFQPMDNDFRECYGCENKYIVLGVAFGWGAKKGLDVFLRLNHELGSDFQIVLVGTDETIERQLPNDIVSIHKTSDQSQLAQIYSAADIFVNPTREDNFPTVNLEALACGTPVITFQTGGSIEAIDNTCGSIVDCDDIDALEREIIRICTEKPYTKKACRERALNFDKNRKFQEYIELYRSVP